jgi:hypothetical protein
MRPENLQFIVDEIKQKGPAATALAAQHRYGCRVIQRLPPYSGAVVREIVRLPWTTAHPIAEPLRVIVNRATDRQERQRYRNARTLHRALEGWLQTDSAAGAGPLALLSDKLRTAGVLPSSPGAAARAARLALMERERTNELAEVVLEDLALLPPSTPREKLGAALRTAKRRGSLVIAAADVARKAGKAAENVRHSAN